MQFPILIGLRRSFLARGLFLLFAVLSLGACFLPDFSPSTASLLALAVLAYSVIAWRRLVVVPAALLLEKSGRIALRLTVDVPEFSDVELRQPLFVHPWLVVIPYRLPGQSGTRRLAVFADSTDAESHRRLRVCLKQLGSTKTDQAR